MEARIEFVHRSWPADPAQLQAIRHELTRWLSPLDLSDDDIAGVVLAVDEAVTNAVAHAYGTGERGKVELTVWTEGGTLSIEVADHGRWRPPGEGGRGIPLMSRMVESVLIHVDGRGSRVLLRQPIREHDQRP